MKRFKAFILNVCLFAFPLTALDFTFTAAPAVNIQLDKQMPIGFSGFLQSDLNLFNFLTFGVEGNYTLFKPDGFNKPIQLYGGGLGLGLYFFPLSRLYFGIGGGAGVNSGYVNVREANDVYNTYNPTGLYYRGYADLGFRFTPDFILTVEGGYLSYVKKDFSNFNTGFFGGVGIKINKSVGSSKSRSKAVTVSLEQYGDIYPSYSRIYRDNECGILTIKNHESAEIRNVHIYFDADKYTSSVIECGTISKLNRYKSVDIPLYIDFSDAIMSFSENGLIPGNVTIEYQMLGQKRKVQQSVTLTVRNRNAFVWDDLAALSTFVSSETPEIQNFAKSVAGIARNELATGMNRNFQFTAAMFLALRCAGITYSEDKLTPFTEYHLSEEEDSVLYPLQTMECLSGDYDDFAILLMSCLESQGISCAYMTTPDDFIVFVDLALSASAVGNHFEDVDSVFVDEEANKVYLPLSMAMFEGGFTQSRKRGSEVLKQIMNDDEGDYEFILLEDAWTVYKPVVFNVASQNLPVLDDSYIALQLKTAIDNYIRTDLNPIVERVRKTGDHNKIGVALVRAKRYSEAKSEFLKANSVAAMNNIANIYTIEQDYDNAMKMYEKVLKQDPGNRSAQSGLESLKTKLGQ